jgi:hypothetical protein
MVGWTLPLPYMHLAAPGPQELFSITVLYALFVSESEDLQVTVFAREVLIMLCQRRRQEFRAKKKSGVLLQHFCQLNLDLNLLDPIPLVRPLS